MSRRLSNLYFFIRCNWFKCWNALIATLSIQIHYFYALTSASLGIFNSCTVINEFNGSSCFLLLCFFVLLLVMVEDFYSFKVTYQVWSDLRCPAICSHWCSWLDTCECLVTFLANSDIFTTYNNILVSLVSR